MAKAKGAIVRVLFIPIGTLTVLLVMVVFIMVLILDSMLLHPLLRLRKWIRRYMRRNSYTNPNSRTRI